MTNSLEYYKVFYYVASTGSLTKAAQALAISQPAVSQSVKQLEVSLGTRLFIRNAKGVRLTKEGEVLYTYVKNGYEQIQLGEEKLFQMLHLELGEIRIGASDMTLRFYLLPFLERFHEQYPNIKVIVSNAPTPETLHFLKLGRIDFGVVSTPFEMDDKIDCIQVKEIEDIFVAGRKFMQYKNRTLDFQELENLPLIFLEKTTSTRKYLDLFFEQNHVKIAPEFELATSDMIVQFALRNLGVGSIMREFADGSMESGQLFELRFNKIIPKRNFCVVTDKMQMMSVAAKNLLRIILESTEID